MTTFTDLPPELRDLVYGFYFTGLLRDYRGSDKYQPTLLRTRRSMSVEAAEVALRIIAAETNAAKQEVGYQVLELDMACSEISGRETTEISTIIRQIIECVAPGQPYQEEWETHGWVWKLAQMANGHQALIARLAKE